MTTQKVHGVSQNEYSESRLATCICPLIQQSCSSQSVYIAVCVTVEYDMLYSMVKGVFKILSISS